MLKISLQERSCTSLDPEVVFSKLRAAVVAWFRVYGRCFPWRETSDPFHVLLAEVLLRRTQAMRLVQPYLELTRRYTDPYALAEASVADLRRWFKPLGLTQRADRMIQAARILVHSYEGNVPNDLAQLMALPGVGAYSARAVLCLGFAEPYPMIDESTGRLLRRVIGLACRGPAYSDRRLLDVAGSIVPHLDCREFNLGLIDLAATYCHPRNPECSGCPLAVVCSYIERLRRCDPQ